MSDDDSARIGGARSDTVPEWEVFVRESASDPLRHVGSVTAPSADVASEGAGSLFGWTAEAIWVCPADDVVRFGGRRLGGGQDDGDENSDADVDAEGAEA